MDLSDCRIGDRVLADYKGLQNYPATIMYIFYPNLACIQFDNPTFGYKIDGYFSGEQLDYVNKAGLNKTGRAWNVEIASLKKLENDFISVINSLRRGCETIPSNFKQLVDDYVKHI